MSQTSEVKNVTCTTTTKLKKSEKTEFSAPNKRLFTPPLHSNFLEMWSNPLHFG